LGSPSGTNGGYEQCSQQFQNMKIKSKDNNKDLEILSFATIGNI